MGSSQITHHIRNAKNSSSLENKIDHILQALDAVAYAMREIETKVQYIENNI